MTTYTIQGRPFEFDETLTYRNFFVTKGKREFFHVRFDLTLEGLSRGTLTFAEIAPELVMLDRWVGESERKRFYRNMKLNGGIVISEEYWFEDLDDGDAIIDTLANTGHVARRLLEMFSPDVAARCKQNPHPASVAYPVL